MTDEERLEANRREIAYLRREQKREQEAEAAMAQARRIRAALDSGGRGGFDLAVGPAYVDNENWERCEEPTEYHGFCPRCRRDKARLTRHELHRFANIFGEEKEIFRSYDVCECGHEWRSQKQKKARRVS